MLEWLKKCKGILKNCGLLLAKIGVKSISFQKIRNFFGNLKFFHQVGNIEKLSVAEQIE